jgi:hypothetical protein
MEKINNIVKEQKFILIDYTTKIKNNFDFVNFQLEKVYKPKYKKVVFSLKLCGLPSSVIKILQKCQFIPLIINDDYILLLNQDNYLFLDASNMHNIHNNTIINFLNDDEGTNTVCNICCNSSEKLTLCCRCAYNMCYECHSKLKSDLCPVCKYNIGTCIKIK